MKRKNTGERLLDALKTLRDIFIVIILIAVLARTGNMPAFVPDPWIEKINDITDRVFISMGIILDENMRLKAKELAKQKKEKTLQKIKKKQKVSLVYKLKSTAFKIYDKLLCNNYYASREENLHNTASYIRNEFTKLIRIFDTDIIASELKTLIFQYYSGFINKDEFSFRLKNLLPDYVSIFSIKYKDKVVWQSIDSIPATDGVRKIKKVWYYILKKRYGKINMIAGVELKKFFDSNSELFVKYYYSVISKNKEIFSYNKYKLSGNIKQIREPIVKDLSLGIKFKLYPLWKVLLNLLLIIAGIGITGLSVYFLYMLIKKIKEKKISQKQENLKKIIKEQKMEEKVEQPSTQVDILPKLEIDVNEIVEPIRKEVEELKQLLIEERKTKEEFDIHKWHILEP